MKTLPLILSIYNYGDYRKWLDDVLQFLNLSRGITVADLCRVIGFKNLGYLRSIVRGERHLHKKRLEAIGEFLELCEDEKAYFRLLVEFANPVSEIRRAVLREQIQEIQQKKMNSTNLNIQLLGLKFSKDLDPYQLIKDLRKMIHLIPGFEALVTKMEVENQSKETETVEQSPSWFPSV